jgi:hypothetical protein
MRNAKNGATERKRCERGKRGQEGNGKGRGGKRGPEEERRGETRRDEDIARERGERRETKESKRAREGKGEQEESKREKKRATTEIERRYSVNQLHERFHRRVAKTYTGPERVTTTSKIDVETRTSRNELCLNKTPSSLIVVSRYSPAENPVGSYLPRSSGEKRASSARDAGVGVAGLYAGGWEGRGFSYPPGRKRGGLCPRDACMETSES